MVINHLLSGMILQVFIYFEGIGKDVGPRSQRTPEREIP